MQPVHSNYASGRQTAGVYVHFPWCLAKCPYCDFVSYRSEAGKIDHEGYADAVLRELDLRVDQLARGGSPLAKVRTIFFGGGTPSLWDSRAIGRVIRGVGERLLVDCNVEITAECNPSSLDAACAARLVDCGVNRLSIGVQSLDDHRLKFLGRLHSAEQAKRSLSGALGIAGLRVSGDLIYAVADQSAESAAAEASELAQMGLQHISAYSLTIEQGTQFGELARRGRLPLCDDSRMVDTFFAVDDALDKFGLAHYEISNFCRPGEEALHNLGYWRGDDYLGLGCGAFGTLCDGGRHIRYRNRTDPRRYVEAVSDPVASLDPMAEPFVESFEVLSPRARLHERIMLGLRLADGFDLDEAERDLGITTPTDGRARTIAQLVDRGRLRVDGPRLSIPKASWIWADDTAARLFSDP